VEAAYAGMRRVPLFATLDDHYVTFLDSVARGHSFERGETIFRKGDEGATLYLILSGEVRIVLPSDGGEECLLAVLGTGDAFGELSVLDGHPRSATTLASETTETMVLHRDDFLTLLRKDPGFALQIGRVLSERLRDADDFLADAIFLDVAARLAKKLLALCESQGKPTAGGICIGSRITQRDLAAMIGATRESVNKHLRGWAIRSILTVDRGGITISRPEELRRRVY
jgi:CRP/FNR family transcriptional regulator, cyclic AMP receptor protein